MHENNEAVLKIHLIQICLLTVLCFTSPCGFFRDHTAEENFQLVTFGEENGPDNTKQAGAHSFTVNVGSNY